MVIHVDLAANNDQYVIVQAEQVAPEQMEQLFQLLRSEKSVS